VGLSLLIVLRNKLFRNKSVCVFMYHHISDNKNVPFNVKISEFEKQMKYLAQKGIVIHSNELENLRRTDTNWDGPKVLLTFDDGYLDFYLNAYPILERLRLPCILFINTVNLDSSPTSTHLIRNQLKLMNPEIVTICSHGHSHAMLSNCDNKQVENEISKSKELIGELPFGNVKFFAYPYGTVNAFDERSKHILREYGFQIAFTSIHGLVNTKTDFLKAPRIKVDNSDSVTMFALAVNGGLNLWRFVDVYFNGLQRYQKGKSLWKK
jgi:peptidoglycan/xylan/chitin deacetylase (PgdA/CDA1 family)